MRCEHRAVHRALIIEAPVERVWHALTDARELAKWSCERANTIAQVGAPYRWEWGGGLHADGQYLRFEPPHVLEMSYRVPAFDVSLRSPTRVSFELIAHDRHCELSFTHTDIEMEPEWDAFFVGHERSWDVDLLELALWCETDSAHRGLRLEFATDATELGDALACSRMPTASIHANRDQQSARTSEFATNDSSITLAFRWHLDRPAAAPESSTDPTHRLILTAAIPRDRRDALDTKAFYRRWQERLEARGFRDAIVGSPYDG